MREDRIRAVIIEDEEGPKEMLEFMLNSFFPNVVIVGAADGVVSGVKLIQEERPDLIFLDIQLSDGSGIDLAEQISHLGIWIIFTTAYSEFAISAFKYLALDFLLKPIDKVALERAINKVFSTRTHFEEQIRQVVGAVQNRKIEKIAVSDSKGIKFLPLNDILYLGSHKNYTMFYMADGQVFTASKTLKHFESFLSSEKFFRIHYQFIVQLEFIEAYLNEEGGKVVLSGGKKLEVSRRRKVELLEILSGN